MKDLLSFYHSIEHFFGSLKFAVFIIGLFSVALAAGTFVESWYGTEYAGRLVYKAWWFLGIQLAMFLSILFATLIRLPPKKHLHGFYLIHMGLLILFLGSFVTYYSGVDGLITLSPNEPSQEVFLNEDELRIKIPSLNKEIRVSLPYTAFEKNLGFDYGGFRISRFIPFARDNLSWIKSPEEERGTSARYLLSNNLFIEEIVVSTDSRSDFTSSTQLGPINVQYLNPFLFECFNSSGNKQIILFNYKTNKCLTIKNLKKLNYSGKVLAEVDFFEEKFKFFPEISPVPLDHQMKFDAASPVRIFDKKLFESGLNIFLFGKAAAFFHKNKWHVLKFDLGDTIGLPWMDLKLKLLEHFNNAYPSKEPYASLPEKNEEILKAVKVEILNKKFWVKSNRPYVFEGNGNKLIFEIGRKKITLPYEITLERFKMETDPGTMNPASFESFVTLFKGNKGSSSHHVSMNNPLKDGQFTFYQSSYFEIEPDKYGSVLSVSFDPGRWLKYLGSFLLVFGSAWHYLIRRKTVQREAEL